ncbi:hypothetical protein [Verrucomicrobium sp. BvORR106]|uniref:hypothetical protein n=1 Tax=Verrucomicrobium sp. BvORR106 TaxID=1403819 RepID=UPI00068D4F5A|nr:hypothetical protein [Verrucomicrobium sp. BvORR106]
MDRLVPPETRARRRFVRASGVLFIAVVQLLMIQIVALYLDDRLISHGSGLLDGVADLIVNGGVLWLIALVKLTVGVWQALRQSWPKCAREVPQNLSWSIIVLTFGLPWIHPEWTWMQSDDPEMAFYVMMGWSIGLPIACSLIACYGAARWLLGPKVRPAPLPYAASSASRSSDGKPLWGYRMIFVTLGWGLLLFGVGMLLERTIAAMILAGLALGCFCQWRDLQYQRFTPAVWYRGLVLMVAMMVIPLFATGGAVATMATVFFGFCIINWAAATARDLFFRRNVAEVGSGIG